MAGDDLGDDFTRWLVRFRVQKRGAQWVPAGCAEGASFRETGDKTRNSKGSVNSLEDVNAGLELKS
jgi:hypothetical protein